MNSDRRQGIEDPAAHATAVVSNVWNSWNNFWSFLFLPFPLIVELLSMIGKKVNFRILGANMIVLGLLISGSFQKDKGGPLATLELNSVKTQGVSPVISEITDGSRLDMCSESTLEEYGVISHMKLLPTVTQNIDPPDSAKKFSWQTSKLDSEDLGTCTCSVSGPPEANYQEEVNGGLLQNFGDNIENHVFNVDSCDSSEENNHLEVASNDVKFLKNYFWSSVFLLVLLLDGIISFIKQKVDIGIGVLATMVLGLGIPGLVESGLPAFPWFNIPILMYLIAYTLMFLSLILRCTSRREWLSYLMVGTTYTCSTFGIFIIIISSLPSEYIFACVVILLFFLVISVVDKRMVLGNLFRWLVG